MKSKLSLILATLLVMAPFQASLAKTAASANGNAVNGNTTTSDTANPNSGTTDTGNDTLRNTNTAGTGTTAGTTAAGADTANTANTAVNQPTTTTTTTTEDRTHDARNPLAMAGWIVLLLAVIGGIAYSINNSRRNPNAGAPRSGGNSL